MQCGDTMQRSLYLCQGTFLNFLDHECLVWGIMFPHNA